MECDVAEVQFPIPMLTKQPSKIQATSLPLKKKNNTKNSYLPCGFGVVFYGKHLLVINYGPFMTSRLFQTSSSEQEDHTRAHSQSLVGFIVFHFLFSPKSRNSGCIMSWQASARETQSEMIGSGGCDFQRCERPYLKGQSPVACLLSFTCVWRLWSQGCYGVWHLLGCSKKP